MAGRPKRPGEMTPVLLRIPPALLARVERCQALLQLQTGVRHTRTMAFEVLLDMGCAATEAGYEQPTLLAQDTPLSPISEISEISEKLQIADISQIPMMSEIQDAIEIEPEPVWETPTQTPAPPVGMKQCRYHHAPYPMAKAECPECKRGRTRRYRARKAL